MANRRINDHPLDNVVWHALRGPQSAFAESDPSGRAVRFTPEVSIFGAVEHVDHESWRAQAELVGPRGFAVLFRGDVGDAPPGWVEVLRAPGLQMVAGDLAPRPADFAPQRLGRDDVDEMLALTKLTEPGPFAARTIELGAYVGVRDADRLVAMAGERLRVPGFTEVSAVCTHPDARKRGLAAALTLHVAHAIRDRGDEAFLHVVDTNENAIRLYEKLGFEIRRSVDGVAFRWLGDDASQAGREPGVPPSAA